MTLSERLRALRRELGLTRAVAGLHGHVSAQGWYKIEAGERAVSEQVLTRFVGSLVFAGIVEAEHRAPLLDELLTLKYLGCAQPYLRELAGSHARRTPWGQRLLSDFESSLRRSTKP